MSSSSSPPTSGLSFRVLIWVAPLLLTVYSAYSCFANTFNVNSDLESYLDIGFALLDGRWSTAANATWGPAYGVLAALALRVTNTPLAQEAVLLSRLNFLLASLCILATYGLIRTVQRYSQPPQSAVFPYFAYGVLGVALVTIRPGRTTPDLSLLLATILITILLVRLAHNALDAKLCVALGLLAAAGYLLKQSFLPCAGLLGLGVLLASRQSRWRNFMLFLVGSAACLPWVLFLSSHRGRFTLGDNGRWNASLFVSRIDNRFWEDVPPALGSPKHPPTLVHAPSGLYLHQGAFPEVSVPMNYDLAWWSEGEIVKLNPVGMIRQLRENLATTISLFRHKGPFLLALSSALLLLLAFRSRSWTTQRFFWLAVLASLAPPAVYLLVHIEFRHLAPFLFFTPLACWLAAGSSATQARSRLLAAFTVLLWAGAAYDGAILLPLQAGQSVDSRQFLALGKKLRAEGLPPQAEVVFLGLPANPYWYTWPRYAEVRLRGVMKRPEAFLATLGTTEGEALKKKLRGQGIRGVIALNAPPNSGFVPLEGPFSLLPL